ncbi:hypothetical protein PDUR_02155 [Paenibacillus durus]|uniref:Uncharacterized protein n=1 Tax=Paenibacillus durus TaxID=44251 RepID=A0A089HG94_PAEDU|nr:hypothetical protein PDUR_02155 [Paenibacillus durus]
MVSLETGRSPGFRLFFRRLPKSRFPRSKWPYAGRCRPYPAEEGHPVTVAGPQRIRTALPY